MSFRTEKIVLTEKAGTYVEGEYVRGERSSTTIMASGQPVLIGQDIDVVPSGRVITDYRKFYTNTKLNALDNEDLYQPDIIVDNGIGYEIMSIERNTCNVISHEKYIAVKVFNFTNVDDWLSGVLDRRQ